MVVLKTLTTPQTFSIIPKETGFTELVVKDKIENTSQVISFVASTGEYFTEITATFELIEGRDYVFYFNLNGGNLHMEKVFCTGQENYSINNGVYDQRQTENEFIVYGE